MSTVNVNVIIVSTRSLDVIQKQITLAARKLKKIGS